jgi:hypothetical protein
MYRRSKKEVLDWQKEAEIIAKKSERLGKKVEKFTGGIVRTFAAVITHSTVSKEDLLLQPILVIKIEMINKKKCKEIGALIEMLRNEEIGLVFIGHEKLEEIFENYKKTVLKLKKFIIDLLGNRTKDTV